MTNKLSNLTTKVNQLNQLLQTANNNKIVWEEIKIVSAKAFDLQDEIMADLQALEETQTDLTKLQSIFDTREIVWNIIAKIAERELEIKEKTTKNHAGAHEKTPSQQTEECCHSHAHSCDCAHTHNKCECDHSHDTCECGKQKKKSSCTCGGHK